MIQLTFIRSLEPHAEAAATSRQIADGAQRALSSNSTGWSSYAVALACYRAGDFAAAVRVIETSIAAKQNYVGSLLTVLAMSRQRLGQPDEAGKTLESAHAFIGGLKARFSSTAEPAASPDATGHHERG